MRKWLVIYLILMGVFSISSAFGQTVVTEATTEAVYQPKVVVIPLSRCAGGLSNCSGTCVNTSYDPYNCGTCGTSCGSDGFCDQGTCADKAGAACTSHNDCYSGYCIKDSYCAIPGNIVFVSSLSYNGDLSGLTGADMKCNTLASAANLPGVYKAWLSDSSASPSTSFNQSTNQYYSVDGTVIATNWNNLIEAELLNQINQSETGTTITSFVWTNTDTKGDAIIENVPLGNCDNFRSNASAWTAPCGRSTNTVASWTTQGVYECDLFNKLYCFQQ